LKEGYRLRKIKFKAWDKEFKRFSEIGLETQAKDIEYATDYIWCQFTGLCDKNGNEIYEGDTVRHFEETGTIKWVKDRFLVSWENDNCNYREDLSYWCVGGKIEVIGNIYEAR
jgi:uncharacterized phage protein (TIGR01671 family)